jgi:hypothetical protein
MFVMENTKKMSLFLQHNEKEVHWQRKEWLAHLRNIWEKLLTHFSIPYEQNIILS